MRRLALVLIGSLLIALPACSDDDEGNGSGDGGGGDQEAFCELLAVAELDPTTAEGRQAVEDALDAAPDELRDDMQFLADLYEDMGDFDEDDPAALAEMLEVLADPEAVEAFERIEQFGVAECGAASTMTFDDVGSLVEE
jgi:hypothetical protein